MEWWPRNHIYCAWFPNFEPGNVSVFCVCGATLIDPSCCIQLSLASSKKTLLKLTRSDVTRARSHAQRDSSECMKCVGWISLVQMPRAFVHPFTRFKYKLNIKSGRLTTGLTEHTKTDLIAEEERIQPEQRRITIYHGLIGFWFSSDNLNFIK